MNRFNIYKINKYVLTVVIIIGTFMINLHHLDIVQIMILVKEFMIIRINNYNIYKTDNVYNNVQLITLFKNLVISVL